MKNCSYTINKIVYKQFHQKLTCQPELIIRLFGQKNNYRRQELTEKQTNICLLLVNGLSCDAFATQLGVRATTVIDYVRKIYQKIGVCNRSTLVALLLLEEKKTALYNYKTRHSAAKLRRPAMQYEPVSFWT